MVTFQFPLFLLICCYSTIKKIFRFFLYTYLFCMDSWDPVLVIGYNLLNITVYFDVKTVSLWSSEHPFKVGSVAFCQASIILFTRPYYGGLNDVPPRTSTSESHKPTWILWVSQCNHWREQLGRKFRERREGGNVTAEAEGQNYMKMPHYWPWNWKKGLLSMAKITPFLSTSCTSCILLWRNPNVL